MRVGRIVFSRHLAMGERSDIGLYEVPIFGSLFGFWIGMIFASFHMWGIVFFVSARLKRAVMYCSAVGPRCFR